MKSKANTVAEYVDSLPPDRREAIQTVRRVILENLDSDIHECMQYGVIGYCVPHTVWPHGHHTNPKLPLMYMGLSSQKNDMVVYMLFLLHNPPEREWFDTAWNAGGAGKKICLEVSGAGCCLRFKKVEDLSLDVIAKAMRRMPMKKYLEFHVAMLARLGRDGSGKVGTVGKGADGKPPEKSEDRKRPKAKTAPPSRRKKTPKK